MSSSCVSEIASTVQCTLVRTKDLDATCGGHHTKLSFARFFDYVTGLGRRPLSMAGRTFQYFAQVYYESKRIECRNCSDPHERGLTIPQYPGR